MNKFRRKRLQGIIDLLQEMRDRLEDLTGEEEEYRDNMPENLKSSENHEKADKACDCLIDAVTNLEYTVYDIEEAML